MKTEMMHTELKAGIQYYSQPDGVTGVVLP